MTTTFNYRESLNIFLIKFEELFLNESDDSLYLKTIHSMKGAAKSTFQLKIENGWSSYYTIDENTTLRISNHNHKHGSDGDENLFSIVVSESGAKLKDDNFIFSLSENIDDNIDEIKNLFIDLDMFIDSL